MVQDFEQKFKEICVEGKRKSLNASSTLYTDKLPTTYYTEAEQEEIEAMYMGTESEARKRFNNSRSRSQTQNQSQMVEQDRSLHQDTIPTTDMIPALEQDSIDSNLL